VVTEYPGIVLVLVLVLALVTNSYPNIAFINNIFICDLMYFVLIK